MGRRCRGIAIGRSCFRQPSSFPSVHVCSGNPHQKLLGLYLLATVMMANFESFSIGYTP